MEVTSENVEKRYTDPITGKFIEGNPGGGRPPDTLEKKIEKKAVKQLVDEYKESLSDVLPMLSPVLKAMALAGEIQAIKEVHDRIMGKPEQKNDITTDGKPIVFVAPEVAIKNAIDSEPSSDSN